MFILLTENIEIVEKERYSDKMEEAMLLLGKDVLGDVPFLALALSTPNNGIWTDDKHFERQKKVKIWKTADVVKEPKNVF